MRKMVRSWWIVLLICFSTFFAQAGYGIAANPGQEQLDLFHKSREYRETYRLPEEQKVELTPSSLLNISFYKIDIREALRS